MNKTTTVLKWDCEFFSTGSTLLLVDEIQTSGAQCSMESDTIVPHNKNEQSSTTKCTTSNTTIIYILLGFVLPPHRLFVLNQTSAEGGMFGIPFSHIVSCLQVHSCSAVCRDIPLHWLYNITSTHCKFMALSKFNMTVLYF